MKVLFATDGAEPSARAGALLARLADPRRPSSSCSSVNDFEVAMREAAGTITTRAEERHAAPQRAADEAAAGAPREAGLHRRRVPGGERR